MWLCITYVTYNMLPGALHACRNGDGAAWHAQATVVHADQ
jgi:hypothetical protein